MHEDLPRAMLAEYEALRRGVGLLDLSARGTLRVCGADRAAFLNNLLTNDIVALQPGQGCNALKVSVQGKIEAALRVLCLESAIWCDLDRAGVDALGGQLRRRILRAEVEIDDTSRAWKLWSLQGPESGALLVRLGVDVSALDAMHRHAGADIAGVEVHIVRSDHTGEGGFDVWAPEEAATRVGTALQDAGAVRVSAATYAVRRVEAGIPWPGRELTPERFPQEAGLDAGWISHSKGCYLGQETIARLHHLGHVNRVLGGAVVEGELLPEAGACLVAGDKELGVVTSAVHSIALERPIVLGFVRREAVVPGTAVRVLDAAQASDARLVALPFVYSNSDKRA